MDELTPLSCEETMELIRLAQNGCREALDDLTRRNMGLVRAVAGRFFGKGAEKEDVVQIGAIGFIKAVKRYDASFGTALSTYAVPLIAGEIRRFLRDDGMIRVGRKYKGLAAEINRLTADALSSGRPAPRIGEIAEKLGEDPHEVAAAYEAAQPYRSLNEPVFGDGSDIELADTLECAEPPEESAVERAFISELMDRLEPDERKLVRLRFFYDLTQADIAGRLGVSQARISRAETRILLKLRSMANGV